MAGLEFCLGFLALLTVQSIDTVLSLVGVICFTGLAAGLAFCKWPQLVRPTAFCFLAKVVQMVLGIFGNAVGSAVAGFATWGALPATGERSPRPEAFGVGFGAAALFVFGTFVSVSLLVFFLYLGRRAWRIDQEYRSMAGALLEPSSMPASRWWIGRLAWAAALFYALVLIGSSIFNLYASVVALMSMPRTAAVLTSSTGVQLTLNPAEWNAQAWKLATDPDPSARNPIEAVRLAERTVAAEPKNADFVKTLGVARYRAGDFAGSIEALNRSIDGQGLSGQAAFFLAMAQARLGRPRRGARVVSKGR